MKPPKVRNNNGRCIIRFTYKGFNHSLTLGDYNNPSDLLKAQQIALEIADRVNRDEFTSVDEWKPRRLEINLSTIIGELKKISSPCSNTTSAIVNLEKYGGEIRNKTEAKKFFDSLSLATATKKRYLTAIRQIEALREIFDFSIKPVKGEEKKEIDPFTTHEIEKIREAMKGNHYEAFILFLLHTGCRPSEAIGTRWKDIEFDSDRIRFAESLARENGNSSKRVRKSTKTGKKRYTPLSEELRELLELLYTWSKGKEDIGNRLIFTSPDLAVINDRNFCNREWKGILEAATVRYRSPYNLRHTFISHCLVKGVDVVTVAFWVGNSPEVIYKHYAGLIEETKLPQLYTR